MAYNCFATTIKYVENVIFCINLLARLKYGVQISRQNKIGSMEKQTFRVFI